MAKCGYVSKGYLSEVIQPKSAVNGRLLLRFHDAASVGRGRHALQPLALAAVSVRAFRAVAHARVFDKIVLSIFQQEF